MQLAYERKLNNLKEDLALYKREKGKEIIELKHNLGKEKETKEHILRKLSIYTR